MARIDDEFALIRQLTGAMKRSSDVVVGVGDDTAVVEFEPNWQVLLACDTMVDTIHFSERTMDPFSIGYKALASNISDVAAMGGIPKFALVALNLPASIDGMYLQEVYRGLESCGEAYGVKIVGGDTVVTPEVFSLSVTIAGQVEAGKALVRSSARPEDVVFVTGPLGGSAAGLNYLLEHGIPNGDPCEENHPNHQPVVPEYIHEIILFHQKPVPQIWAGRLLNQSGICHALNDISDGLASEAWEIAESSGVVLRIFQDKLPVHPSVKSYAEQIHASTDDWIWYGGEDYQLIGTVPKSRWEKVAQSLNEHGITLYCIGEVLAGTPRVEYVDKAGVVHLLEKKGYNHFAKKVDGEA